MYNASLTRKALEDDLRDRVENAAAKYQAVKKAAIADQELKSQVPSPDGCFALIQALRTEREALAEYKRALTMFNNLIVYDMVPDEGDDGELLTLQPQFDATCEGRFNTRRESFGDGPPFGAALSILPENTS